MTINTNDLVVALVKAAKSKTPEYKGVHTVFSGLNEALKSYGVTDPVAVTKAAAEAGKVVTRFARGGAILYLPEDAPESNGKGKELLTVALASLGKTEGKAEAGGQKSPKKATVKGKAKTKTAKTTTPAPAPAPKLIPNL